MVKEVIDVFCGAGVGSCGLALAGFSHLLGIDIDPWALLSFAANFRCAVAEADLGAIPLEAVLRRHHVPRDWSGLFWISSPCTDFSSAGIPTANDSRRNLLFIALEAAEFCPDSWVICENVPAMKTKNGGRHYQTLLQGMAKLGRRHFEFKLKAQDFGLAQSRERLFLLFPPESFKGTVEKPQPTGTATLRTQIGKGFIDPDPEFVPLSGTEAVMYGEIGAGKNWRASARGRAYARHKGCDGLEGSKVNEQFLRYPGWDELSPCIMASGGCQSSARLQNIHPAGRRFSVGEQRVLMGIPEDFVLCGPLEERIRQVGNGVVCPIAKALADRIVEAAERREPALAVGKIAA